MFHVYSSGYYLPYVYLMMTEKDVEYPYSLTDFTSQGVNYRFETLGGLADFYGEWAYYFEGTYNGHEFDQRIELINGCRFALKMAMKNGKLTYDISDWAKEKLSKDETEHCVRSISTEIDANVYSMVEKRSQKAT